MFARLAFVVTVIVSCACAAPAQQATATVPPPADDRVLANAYAARHPGLVVPKLKFSAKPKYTRQAMQQKIEGTVVVEAVVMPDGKVGVARVTRSLDKLYGLDAAALDTARQWLFDPGTIDGKPVPVIVVIELEFRLH